MRARRVFFGMLALAVAALAIACGGPAPADKPVDQAAATPAATPAKAPDVGARMDDHFVKVTEVNDAVIRGDFEAAKAPARALADEQPVAGLPAAAAPSIEEMKKAARQVAESTDMAGAAQGAAAMAVACGNCHVASSVKPKFQAPAVQKTADEARGHMIEHQHAIELLYQGLVGPSDQAWADGAKALKEAPLAGARLPKDPALTREKVAAEAEVHSLAEKAAGAANVEARAQIYARLVGSCADCHGLHGKTWGPGLPK